MEGGAGRRGVAVFVIPQVECWVGSVECGRLWRAHRKGELTCVSTE